MLQGRGRRSVGGSKQERRPDDGVVGLLARFDDASAAISAPRGLREFHAAHKIEILAHDPETARTCGRIAAGATAADLAASLGAYRAALAVAGTLSPSVGRHANALRHLAGHLAGGARAEAARLVDGFAEGALGLDEVRSRLRVLLEEAGEAWAAGQSYLAAATDPLRR